MKENLNIRTADWNCPSIEKRKAAANPDQSFIASLADVNNVRRIMEETAGRQRRPRYILPVWQNLESVVWGTRILNSGRYFSPSDYCVEKLCELRAFDFDLLSDPLIQAVIHTIPYYKGRTLILEAESPFSVLSAIMNPVDLYLCFEEEQELLLEILHKIADASSRYIRACVDAGCRIISLADPVGTMNLIGEDYYKKICGESERYLMKKCRPFLDRAIVHICKKMSQSLLIAGLAEAEACEMPQGMEDYADILMYMAENPQIHFTGMTCIHNNNPELKKCYVIAFDHDIT